MSLKVLSPGFLCTIQDTGRYGYGRFGVPASGPMDWAALRSANRLVGNDPGRAALEFAMDGPVLEAQEDCLVVVTGRGFRLWVQGRRIGLWMAAWARRGERVEVRADGEGAGRWGYLAAAGGFQVPPVLGACSTYLRGKLGGLQGQALVGGEHLELGAAWSRRLLKLAGRRQAPRCQPAYADEVEIPVVLGPQADVFEPESVQRFLNEAYTITPASDRMGYRLEGPALRHRRGADLLSEGMPVGSIQVPASGMPMVMMSDGPTTGGYPKVAVAARAGLPLAAQAPPGRGQLRFRAVAVAEAQRLFREMVRMIDEGVEE